MRTMLNKICINSYEFDSTLLPFTMLSINMNMHDSHLKGKSLSLTIVKFY